MKFAVMSLLACLMIAPLARGQKLELKLDAIAQRASSKTEVDLDGAVLQMALGKAVQSKDVKKVKGISVPDLLAGIKGVQVRSYQFDNAGAYSEQELEPVRKQVREGSGWSRIVSVKEKNESTEIFILSQGDEIGGCLILVAEPKELTVVHIVGTVTLAQMKELVNSNIKYDLAALQGQSAK